MSSLALIIIGILAGFLVTFTLGITVVVGYLSYHHHQDMKIARELMTRTVNRSTIAIDRMRGEVQLALSSMDADRLHDASLTIQQGVKSLQSTVGSLGKLVFAAGAGDAMGLPQDMDNGGLMGYGGLTSDPYYDRGDVATNQAAQAGDPFTKWRAEANLKHAAAMGQSTPLPPASLPDLQQPDGQPLPSEADDSYDDAYLNEYVERERSGHLDDLPGVTEVSDGGPVGKL